MDKQNKSPLCVCGHPKSSHYGNYLGELICFKCKCGQFKEETGNEEKQSE